MTQPIESPYYRFMYVPQSYVLNFVRFFQNLSETGLITVAKRYNLQPTDLWKATRRLNMADIMSDEAETCKCPKRFAD